MDWPTILVAALIGVLFIAIVVTQIRDRRKGKSACGGNCSACNGCHKY